jgi:hypothetical protein
MKQKIILPIFFLMILSLSFFVSAEECTDTDGGRNYFEKGTTTNMPPEFRGILTDECISPTRLQEGTCIEGLGVHTYDCANGCKDGACIKGEKKEQCIDTDGGKSYYTKGKVYGSTQRIENGIREYQIMEDICVKDNQVPQLGKEEGLFEYFCNKEGYVDVTSRDATYICPFGCEDGKCLGTEKIVGVTNEPVEIPAIDQINRIVYTCGHNCQDDNKCYPFGYRKSKKYCSEEGFSPQLSSGYQCKNNFECNSNLCLDNACASNNIFAKFFRWLKNLF